MTAPYSMYINGPGYGFYSSSAGMMPRPVFRPMNYACAPVFGGYSQPCFGGYGGGMENMFGLGMMFAMMQNGGGMNVNSTQGGAQADQRNYVYPNPNANNAPQRQYIYPSTNVQPTSAPQRKLIYPGQEANNVQQPVRSINYKDTNGPYAGWTASRLDFRAQNAANAARLASQYSSSTANPATPNGTTAGAAVTSASSAGATNGATNTNSAANNGNQVAASNTQKRRATGGVHRRKPAVSNSASLNGGNGKRLDINEKLLFVRQNESFVASGAKDYERLVTESEKKEIDKEIAEIPNETNYQTISTSIPFSGEPVPQFPW